MRIGGPVDVGGEARRGPRVRVDLPATVGGRVERAARVVDLSLVGCLVRSESALDAGAVVNLRIELPDGPLEAKARVAAVSVDGDSLPGPARQLAGLEILALAAAAELRLRTFLEAESKRRRGAPPPPR
jgi:hypothetical protein